MDRFHVYRLFDANDQLLYVGATKDVAERTNRHRLSQPWWPEVARTVVSEPYASWESAHEAEREAIRAEAPRHNGVRYKNERPWRPTVPEWDEAHWQEVKSRFEELPEDLQQLAAEYASLHMQQLFRQLSGGVR